MRETILEWTRPDQTRRIELFRHANAFYSWSEERFVSEFEEGFGLLEYWIPFRQGGLYPSIIDAQNDAAMEFPWLAALLAATASAHAKD
jgi:hypothetical protein